MTARPLLRHTIAQLEELFATKRTLADVLKELEAELQFRHVPRAVSLLAKVRAVSKGGNLPAPPKLRSFPRQPEISSAATSVVIPLATTVVPVVQAKSAPPTGEDVPTITLEEAYKLLRATAGSSWAEIEQVRRFLVQRAHPDNLAELSADKRTVVQADVKRANMAYSVILQSKIK